jgi:hypothetical protein
VLAVRHVAGLEAVIGVRQEKIRKGDSDNLK